MSVKHQSVCFFRTEHDKTSPAWWESPSSQRTGGVYVAWRAAGLLTQLSSNSPAAAESNQSGLLLMNLGTSSDTGCSLQTSCLLRPLAFIFQSWNSLWLDVRTWLCYRTWSRDSSALCNGPVYVRKAWLRIRTGSRLSVHQRVLETFHTRLAAESAMISISAIINSSAITRVWLRAHLLTAGCRKHAKY